VTRASARFALDSPPTTSGECVVRSPFVVSGWVISRDREMTRIEVKIGDQVRASARIGLRRPDVEDAFPDEPDARWSGFGTEVFADDLDGVTVAVAVNAVSGDGELPLARFLARVDGRNRVISPRPRTWRFADILGCPRCLGDLGAAASCWQCVGCGSRFPERRGIPVFTHGGEIIQSRLLEVHPTNPNAEDQTAIIMDPANALVLDLGAGNPRPSEHHPNVVFHEWAHYAHTDVVSVCERLPYREGVFHAVISKATFEHVARPWEMADEVYRVLKPGGLVHVDTAFMQPLHADPHHFFNMTQNGVREIFRRFTLVRCGVKPYQTPAYGLRMQIEVLLDHLHAAEWRRRFEALHESLGGLDSALDARGRERLAAGVFFEGIKPAP
jgi:SAM-dependent methyltransferase